MHQHHVLMNWQSLIKNAVIIFVFHCQFNANKTFSTIQIIYWNIKGMVRIGPQYWSCCCLKPYFIFSLYTSFLPIFWVLCKTFQIGQYSGWQSDNISQNIPTYCIQELQPGILSQQYVCHQFICQMYRKLEQQDLGPIFINSDPQNIIDMLTSKTNHW